MSYFFQALRAWSDAFLVRALVYGSATWNGSSQQALHRSAPPFGWVRLVPSAVLRWLRHLFLFRRLGEGGISGNGHSVTLRLLATAKIVKVITMIRTYLLEIPGYRKGSKTLASYQFLRLCMKIPKALCEVNFQFKVLISGTTSRFTILQWFPEIIRPPSTPPCGPRCLRLTPSLPSWKPVTAATRPQYPSLMTRQSRMSPGGFAIPS